jgi:hypothetical protein
MMKFDISRLTAIPWRMKSLALLFITITALISTSFNSGPDQNIERSVSIPATVCPKFDGEARNTALLPSAKSEIKQATTRKLKFVAARSNPYLINNTSLVIAGSEVTSAVIRSKSGVYTAATTCLIGSGDQWFIGPSADLGSFARLLIVNSGLSTASIEIESYKDSGKVGSRSLAIAAVSQREIRLDSLAPGAKSVAIRVLTKAGRVTAFLFDERRAGLRTLGGDFLASHDPGLEIVIPAIPTKNSGQEISAHSLRVVATGARAAIVNVELLSDGSRFTPVGLSDVVIKPGEVKTLKLPRNLGKRPAALLIRANEPITASVYSQQGNEFSWTTPARAISNFIFNVGGLEPTLTLVGDRIEARIETSSRDGKRRTQIIRGEEMVNWKIPPNTRVVNISSLGGQLYLGASWSTSDGFTSIALNPGTELERTTTPIFDIDALFG